MDPYHFPTDPPIESVRLVIQHVRGGAGAPGRKRAVDAAWWAAGYPISFMPEDEAKQQQSQAAAASAQLAEASDEELADQLHNIVSRRAGATQDLLKQAFLQMLPILMQFVQRWAFGA